MLLQQIFREEYIIYLNLVDTQMDSVKVTSVLADAIVSGLIDGTLERFGGVIRDTTTQQVVTWLRELEETPINLSKTEAILQLGSTASVLNLGISVMGFAVISKKLEKIEQNLKETQELLNKINRKIDLGYYANFRAALELAVNAFTMNKPENRRSSALQAINRFLEAEQHYLASVDEELEKNSQIINEYLLTLSLAYIAEVRCYLELGEFDTARRRFQECSKILRSRIQKYIEMLLTPNPAVYLHPQFKGKIDLSRLTRIYRWIDKTLDENAVFEMQRDNLFSLMQDENKWLNAIPPVIGNLPINWGFKLPWNSSKSDIYARLPQAMEIMESLIESDRRFEAYQLEVQAIDRLGISFNQWLQISPETETIPDGAKFMYITPQEPLEVEWEMGRWGDGGE